MCVWAAVVNGDETCFFVIVGKQVYCTQFSLMDDSEFHGTVTILSVGLHWPYGSFHILNTSCRISDDIPGENTYSLALRKHDLAPIWAGCNFALTDERRLNGITTLSLFKTRSLSIVSSSRMLKYGKVCDGTNFLSAGISFENNRLQFLQRFITNCCFFNLTVSNSSWSVASSVGRCALESKSAENMFFPRS